MLPLFVAGLSLVPGVGHLALGKRKKAVALFVIDLGMVVSLFFLKSTAGHLLVSFGYLMVMVPAVIETYALAHGGVSRFSESKPYVVALLLMTGLSALPLLWQSPAFSKKIKITWSVVVPVLAILHFTFLSVYGMRLFKYVDSWLG